MKNTILGIISFAALALPCFFANPAHAAGPTYVPTTIVTSTTWTAADSPFIVSSNVTIYSGATVTIESAVVVKFGASSSYMDIFGSIIAEGTTSSPVFFTSLNDDAHGGSVPGSSGSPAAGDWSGIVIEGASSTLTHVQTLYGGHTFSLGVGSFTLNDGSLTLAENRISQSSNDGIYVSTGTLTVTQSEIDHVGINAFDINRGRIVITGSTIHDNSFGITTAFSGTSPYLELDGNTFTNNFGGVSFISADTIFVHSDNHATGNGNSPYIGGNGFVISGSTQRDVTWTSDTMPYVAHDLLVAPSTTLIVQPGVIVKPYAAGNEGFIRVLGSLVTQGIAANPVIFTSMYDDGVGGDTNNDATATTPSAGDWAGITFESGSTSTLTHTNLFYGGAELLGLGTHSTLTPSGGNLNLSNVRVSQSANAGMEIANPGTPVITQSEFDHNPGYAIKAYSTFPVTIHNSSIHDNGYGIFVSGGSTTSVDATSNWWGDASGPGGAGPGTGDFVSSFVSFNPFLTYDPTKEPVVIVPGIMGSKLNRVSDNGEVWPDALDMLKLGPDDYLNDLKLSSDGSETVDIKTGDIERSEILGLFTFYQNLIQSLKDAGYTEGADLFVAPYDWRFGVASSVNEVVPVLQNALSHSPNGRINVIAHSMGGLVMKQYLATATSTAFIDKFIVAGVPQLGAPKALKILNYGDDLDLKFFGLGLNQDKVKEISQNMPGVYNLLPSRKYVQNTGGYVQDFRNGQNKTLNFNETNALVSNASMVSSSDAFHQPLDDQPFNFSTSSVYNIVGCHVDTVGDLRLYDKKTEIGVANGDGTVTLPSATSSSAGYHNFFALEHTHLGLVKDTAPLTLIHNILNNDPNEPIFGISPAASDCNQSALLQQFYVSSHSPVELNAYDAQGNHTGPNTASGTIETAIPGSDYESIDHNSFIFLPATGTYSIVFQATATGTVDLEIETASSFITQAKTTYLAVPLTTTQTKGNLSLSVTSTSPILNIDTDGNGTIDATSAPTAVLTGSSSQDVVPPTLTMPTLPVNPLQGSTTTLVFSATDTGSGIYTSKATLNGSTVTSGSVVTLNQLGTNLFHFEAEDYAGNPSVEEATFTVISVTTALTATADTYIVQTASNTNFGTSSILRLQQSPTTTRSLIQFDENQIAAAIPASSTLVSATLQLTVSSTSGWTTTGTLELHRMTYGWTENGATWNCSVDTNTSNNTADCSSFNAWHMTGISPPYISATSASTTVSNSTTGIVSLDVTSDIQSFISGTHTNLGWILKKADESASGLMDFYSREGIHPPTLTLQYRS